MLSLSEEKHLIYFDELRQYFSSYSFILLKKPMEEKTEEAKEGDDAEEQKIIIESKRFILQLSILNSFTFEWISDYYDIKLICRKKQFGAMPFSLETYLDIYDDPRKYDFELTLKSNFDSLETIYEKKAGKLIIKSSFRGNPFLLPIRMYDSVDLINKCVKQVSVGVAHCEGEIVVCAGSLGTVTQFEELSGFVGKSNTVYRMYSFEVNEWVGSEEICVLKGLLRVKRLKYKKITVFIVSERQQPRFIPNLMQHFNALKSVMELENIMIVQNIDTEIQEAHQMVFEADPLSLESRIFKAMLHDKVKEKWLVQGMTYYNRSQKQFQECAAELIDLITEGEELFPLCNETYSFDQTWKVKARWFYHILANFKTVHDSGASLANLIIEQSRKGKGRVNSQMLFKRLKNKYFKKCFRTNYEHQFVKCTGVARIFYQLIDVKRENKVKIIVRQKALANKTFRLYNASRIKLEQAYDIVSPITSKIISKNKLDDEEAKRELSGPLAVPKFLKCIAYFKGSLTVETDASDQTFQIQLREENIIQEKQNATAKIRTTTRKNNDVDRTLQGYNWIMIDTAQIYPAVYKNENVQETTILDRVRKKYESQQQEIKVLNCISSRDHSASDKLCRALMDKLKVYEEPNDNSSLTLRRKILQILPIFLSKSVDFLVWEDYLAMLKLYEPVCYDHSEEGFLLLLSLLESLASLQYVRAFHYFFEQFHKVLLAMNQVQQPQEQLFKCHLFAAMLKWVSKYCIDILMAVREELELCLDDTRAHLPLLIVLFKHIFPYLQKIHLPESDVVVHRIKQLLQLCLKADNSYELYVIKFEFQLTENQKVMDSLQFLKSSFKILEDLSQGALKKYWRCLQAFKDVLGRNKKKYCLEIQLSTLNNNQAFFVAEYLWGQLCSQQALQHAQVRLQWLKIYRMFYFYYTPIATYVILKASLGSPRFGLSEGETKDVLDNLADFMPDIKWFSGYDSKTAKKLKFKYEQLNENKRKKKFEEYHFSQKNCITIFLKDHPGRESWEELCRQALRIFIQIYGGKEQNAIGPVVEKYKVIEEGLKRIEQKLKRGRMPELYSYAKLKDQIYQLLDSHEEVQARVIDVFTMVDDVLRQIAQAKQRKEAESRDEMRIVINLDEIVEDNQEDEEARPNNKDFLLFGEDNEEAPDKENVEEDKIEESISEENQFFA